MKEKQHTNTKQINMFKCASSTVRTQRAPPTQWLIALLLLPLITACGNAQPTTQTITMPVQRGNLVQSVSGSGQIQPLRESYLNFAASGTVAEVFVTEGQEVQAGNLLAVLDTDDLDQHIRQAEADLKSAQANLAELQAGPIETDVLTAQSQLDSARLQLSQTANGNARPSDIANAQAQLESARAALEALLNPSAIDQRAAELDVQSAQTNLQSVRDTTSANKTKAESQLDQAANTLRDAQDAYAQIYWENRELEGNLARRGAELPQENKNQEAAALRAVQDAEESLHQAQVAYDNARQQEISDIRFAENQLAEAQRQLEALLDPSAEAIAQARAQVAQAEAQLAQQTSGTQTDIALAQETVEQRQITLDALQSPPTESELAQEEAQLAQAEVALAQALQNRANAELAAPFNGIVAAVNITPGDTSSEGNAAGNDVDSAAIYLIDTSTFHVNVQISEVDLDSLEMGQTAEVTIESLSGAQLTGTLNYIALTPTIDQNVTTYAARIDLAPTDLTLRVGMSALVTIIAEQRGDVLLVPNIAIRQSRNTAQVMLQQGDRSVPTPIEIGLVGQTQTEVVTGLQEGDIVVVTVEGDSASNNRVPGGGFFPGGGGGGGGRPGGPGGNSGGSGQ
ncbi:MAG: efflux RND transporter periplasmic adaptor subunit [Chloroflexales bacterium]|nr:efflux RND transporter periplasmic adaptor subunit [Chloroflexales bacterium]